MIEYTIEEHIHRYACWTASRAASVNNYRFKVEFGRQLLDNSPIRGLIKNPELLPESDKAFDEVHLEWRTAILADASLKDVVLSHGIAAKIINIYLKTIIICGGFHAHKKARHIHPPIDSLLLNCLQSKATKNQKVIWSQFSKIRWSNFNSEEYQRVIDEVRINLNGRPMWTIEECWRGYQ